jgi:hypothetical protein
MDTKYWGPSGWKLLHLIAETDSSQGRKIHRKFWETLPYVLPCKFCRASLTEYYEKYPIPTKSEDMGEWLYKIHNCVNEKLRSQGQTIPPNPPYEAVSKHYKELLERGCTETVFPGWTFLFSIADSYPGSAPSKPMPDTPADTSDLSVKQQNRYNLLGNTERVSWFRRFWKFLPNVLPFPLWTNVWRSTCKGDYSGRGAAKRTVWGIRCALDAALKKKSETTYHGLCKELAQKRSGCSTARRARTCRAPRKH